MTFQAKHSKSVHNVKAVLSSRAQRTGAFGDLAMIASDSCAVMTQHFAQECTNKCAIMTQHLAQGCTNMCAIMTQHLAQGSQRAQIHTSYYRYC